MSTVGFPCPEDAGLGTGTTSQEGSVPPSRGLTEPPPPPAGWPWLGTFALDPTSFVFTPRSGQKVRNLLVGVLLWVGFFGFFFPLDKLKDPK